MHPEVPAHFLKGRFLDVRYPTVADAEFTLALRLDPRRAACFASPVEDDIAKQRAFIESVLERDGEAMYMFDDKQGNPVGTASMYGLHDEWCVVGRWNMADGVRPEAVVELMLLGYDIAFDFYGVKGLRFDVMKTNVKHISYHRLWGARIVNEDEREVFFELPLETYRRRRPIFARRVYSDV